MAIRKDADGNIWTDAGGKWAIKPTSKNTRVDEAGNEWVEDDSGKFVKSTKAGSGLYESPIGDQQKANFDDKASDYERELQMRGPAAQKRSEEAKDIPLWKQMLLTAADETKSLTSGMRDIVASHKFDLIKKVGVDMILPGLGDLFVRDKDELAEAQVKLEGQQAERAEEKKLFREADEEFGLGQIGRMLPYMVTGAAEAPISDLYRGGVKAITDITRKGRPQPINATGRKTILPEYAGAGTLGTIEGGIHESEGADQGLMSSLLGKFGGRQLGKFLEKAPNENSNFDNDLIERWREKGYHASPGMRTGNKKEQRNDAVQQTDPRFSGWYDERNRLNDEMLLKEIKTSAGFGKDGIGDLNSLPPERINAHIDSLKNEYQVLEANTKGRIPSSDFVNIRNSIDHLPEADIARIKKDFIRFTGGKRDGNGKLKISDRNFNGTGYQNELRRLKDGKARAIAETNKPLADVYDQMMKSLAGGLEGGMKKHQVERWRDLNERWAMSKLIIDKGLDATNKIDTRKLLDNINRTDIDRLVTGQGGRVRGFHDVVRMKELERQQKAPGMGEGMSDLSDREKKARERGKPSFYSGPEKSATTPVDNFLMNFQYGGIFGQPRKIYGLLGNPREGIMSTGSVMRSLEQGTDAKMNLLNLLDDKKDQFKNYVEKQWTGKE